MAACAVTALGAVLSACAADAPDGSLRIAVTVEPLAGVVDRVAPGLAEVTVMIPTGASPESYEPSVSDVRAAVSADIYVSVGHDKFAWEATWLAALLEGSGSMVLPASENCELLPDDPHVWLSFECVRELGSRFRDAVAEARPAFADSVRKSFAAFDADLQALADHAEDALGPRRGGRFISLHPAWGYLARDYGLEQLTILDHGSGDAGTAGLAAIVRQARQLGIGSVIVQPQFSAEPARLVAAELGGRVVIVDPLGRDWTATMFEAIDVLASEARP